MKIEMLTSLAGVRHCFNPGDVVERDADEGQRLIDAGFARLAQDGAEVTAVEPVGEPEPGEGDPRYAVAPEPAAEPAPAPVKQAAGKSKPAAE